MPVNDNENINKRLIGSLSICRKAGKLVCGFDPSKDAVMNGKAPLVLTAADINADPERIGKAGSATQVVRTFTPAFTGGAERITGTPKEAASKIREIIGRIL